MITGGFSESEGSEAVLARGQLDGRRLSTLSAQTISRALGNDPLLIALNVLMHPLIQAGPKVCVKTLFLLPTLGPRARPKPRLMRGKGHSAAK